MKRIHLVISGDVQGVSFRAWARAQARELNLTGWIKNRPDGRVETVAEGQKEKLEEFIEQCHKGPEVAWVENVDVKWGEGDGQYVTFEVIY